MPVENDQANVSMVSQAHHGRSAMYSSNGFVAQRLLNSGFDANSLRTNDTLRKDEWKMYDTAIVGIAKARLRGVADLMAAGLTYSLPNALGVTRLEWENDTDMTPAGVSMSGIDQTQDDRVEYSLTGMPVPIIHKDFTLNLRQLEASRKTGLPLDTTMAQKASRVVSEKIEDMLWNGYTGLGANNTIYGYLTTPNRNTGSLTNAAWTAGTVNGETILADVLAMIQKALDDHMYGPFVLYVPIAIGTLLGNDFKTNSDKSVRERLLEIDGLSDIRSTANLTGLNVLLVQLTADVVQMVDGIQPRMVQWDSHGGFVLNFKIIAIMLPRFRNDSEGQSGIVHYSGT